MNHLTQTLQSSITVERLKAIKKELIKQAQIIQRLIEEEERKVLENETEIEEAII